MIAIGIMCIILVLGFISIGTWAYRLFHTETCHIGWAFWLGLAITIGILQIWHFFTPINDTTRIVLILITLISLVINHRYIIKGILPITSLKILWGVMTLITSIWLINRATFSYEHFSAFGFDSGFYHIPVIKWFSEHPVILGLGNVHTRFGFSNAFFLYGALVNWDIFIGKTYQILNTVLYIVFLSQMIFSVLTLFRNKKHSPQYLEHLFRILCIPFVILWLLYRYEENLGVPSTSNDVPIFILSILLAGRLIRHIEQQDITLPDLFHIGILVACGITIKFNFIFGAGLLIVSISMYLTRNRQNSMIALIGLTLIGLTFFVPMFLRSILMTGYPLFPLTVGGIDVNWRVPEGIGQLETEYIQIFARALGDTPMFETLINNPNADWIGFWLEKSAQNYPALLYPSLLLAMIGGIAIIMGQIIPQLRAIPAPEKSSYWWLGLLAVTSASVVFWFINAPLWRLSVGVTWFFGAILAVLGMRRLRINIHRIIASVLIIGLTSFVIIDGLRHRNVSLGFVSPQGMTEPVLWVEPATTYSGTTVYVAQNWLCWNYAIPCVPKPLFNPLLRERMHGNMSSGYQTTHVAMPIDASNRRIQLAHETFSALKIDQPTSFDIAILQNDDIIIQHSTNIYPLTLDNRSQISYNSILGEIELPDMPNGIYQVTGTWQNIQLAIADMWQIRAFRFGDMMRLTDTLIRRDDNRVMIQLVGEALNTIPSRYHVAIWLRGENGVFQRDVSPIIPTHDWVVGGRYLITAYFDDIPTGNYDLSVVWYDIFSPNLRRLNGFDDQNNLLGEQVTLLTGDL